MNIILPIATEQSITVYTRTHTGTDYTINITDEETNKTTEIEYLSSTFIDFDEQTFVDFDGEPFADLSESTTFTGKLTVKFEYDFKEGRFYMIEVEAEKLIYRGKLYCTAQTGQYAVSSYTKPALNKNEFIVKQ